jgi:F-type H+-transporting ATPase subunit epsilon
VATAFACRVITPERVVYEGEVDYLHVSGTDGDLGVLAHHLPIVVPLKVAPVELQTDSGRVRFAVHGGFLEVGTEGAVVLARTAEAAAEIDVERARAALDRARRRIEQGDAELDLPRARAAERRALCRLSVAGAVEPAAAVRTAG